MASTDRDALVALYEATDGASWTYSDNWNTDVDLSQWHRVEVTGRERVVKLDLELNNLRGSRSSCDVPGQPPKS